MTAQPKTAAARPKLAGQIVNTGAQSVGRASVIAAVFSSSGKLVEVNNGLAALERLAPGQSTPFEVDLINDAVEDPSNYHLYTEARVER